MLSGNDRDVAAFLFRCSREGGGSVVVEGNRPLHSRLRQGQANDQGAITSVCLQILNQTADTCK